MASEDETAVAGISTPSKPDMEEEKATEQTVADAVADVDAPAPQELREEQIENAVAFLAHPKVRGSTIASKRAFLEGKGLTGDEIDESFRRVPEAPAPALPQSGAAPRKPYPTPSAGALQPYQAPVPAAAPQVPPPPPPAPEPIRWTQAVAGAGVLAAGAYGVHRLLTPRLMQWYRMWRHGEAPPASDAQPGRATAELVAAALKEQAAEVRAAVESVRELARAAEKGKAPAGGPDALSLADLRSELRSFGAALSELGDPAAPKQAAAELREAKDEIRALKDAVAKLAAAPAPAPAPAPGLAPGRPNGLLAGAGPAAPRAAPARPTAFGSYAPGSAAPAAPPAAQPPVPWAAHGREGMPQAGSAAGGAPGGGPDGEEPHVHGMAAGAGMGGPPGSGPQLAEPPHPASYMEVLEMLEKGETPPGIRADIVDTPPDPAAPPPPARLAPRLKPWERAASGPPPAASLAAAAAGAGSGAGFPPASRVLGGAGARAADGAVQITELAAEADGAPAERAASSGAGARTPSPRSHAGAPVWKPPAVPQATMARKPSGASARAEPAASESGSATGPTGD